MSFISDRPFLPPEEEGLDTKKWVLAGTLVLLAHAGLVFWLTRPHEDDLAAGQLEPAVMIDLGPEAMAPPVDTPAEVAPQQMTEADPEENKEKPDPDPVPDQPVPPPELPPLPETPVVPKAEVVMPAKPVIKKPPPKKKDVKKEHAPKTTAPVQTNARASNAAASAATGAGGSSAAANDWKSRVFSQLARNKRYPDSERQNGVQGVVGLAFTIDRSGNVLSAHVSRSSGSSALDNAAVEMVHRASPLPAPPDDIGGSRITLSAPVRFSVH